MTERAIFCSIMCSTAIELPCASHVKMLESGSSVFEAERFGPPKAHDSAELDLDASK